MSATKTRAETATKTFALDHRPEIGDPVLWWEGGETQTSPTLAFVVSVGMEYSVGVAIVAPDRQTLRSADGVRHADDPRAKRDDTVADGVWRHTPRWLQLLELSEQFSHDEITPTALGIKANLEVGANK
jgi:hypothetical protein